MKKVTSLIFCILTFGGCSSHKDFAEEILEFNLPKKISTLKNDKDFYSNPTGDGEEFAIFSFLSDDSLFLVNNCIANNYTPLPIDKGVLPDGAVYQWVGENDSVGYYKLEVDTFDNTSYSIAVVNMVSKRIIVYRVFY